MSVTLQKRTAKRSRVLLHGTLETADRRHDVRIRDVSTHGALLEAAADAPAVGETVTLRCGDTSAEARVAWIDGSRAGIEFVKPLREGHLADSLGSKLRVSAPRSYRPDRVPEPEERLEDLPQRSIRMR